MDTDTTAEQPLLQWSSQAVIDVAAERRRQIEVHSYPPEHDDEHDSGELAQAAAGYALHKDNPSVSRQVYPWGFAGPQSGPRREMMVKAGALILAEIERLDRAA